MKAVLLSIQPKWCERIASGKKTIELRKTKPKISAPFKCYIYCTRGVPLLYKSAVTKQIFLVRKRAKTLARNGHTIFNGNVIGEFICDRVYDIYEPYLTWLEEKSCVDMNDIALYKGDNDLIYGLHISDLKVYDKPKSLSEFKNSKNKFIERAFQSWGYVEEI